MRRSIGLVGVVLAVAMGAGLAAAQTSQVINGTGLPVMPSNAVRDGVTPWNFGVLAQGGVGVTEDRSNFRFFSAGVRAGKVLTATAGSGLLRGNFEYGVEVFPLWQSYTPVMQRQSCVPIAAGSTTVRCSGYFNTGGTYTGVSITPAVLRWNFAGWGRVSPWVQGAGGVVWTNHKYPGFGGPPGYPPGTILANPSGNGYTYNSASADTSVWNFTPQFGVGMHWFLRPKRSVDFGANAIHVSSASLGDRNPGVNASVQFTVGYSWWK
ncbi:MAG TPA: acyloxyacyl hydrolase [Acidobacteriaceae bacterium]|nr:acyloxyacyl hydrolase [Acidobacteriaceae bacterium]